MGDLFTPISLFKKLTDSKKFLFESSFKHQNSGRYSFVGSKPAFELIGTNQGGKIIHNNGQKEEFIGNPLFKLKELMAKQDYLEALELPFIGGGIGYVGYDMIRQFEEIGEELEDVIGMPDLHLMFFEVIIVFDHLEQKIHLVGTKLTDETSVEELKNEILKLKQEILADEKKEEVLQGFHFNLSFKYFASKTIPASSQMKIDQR